MKKIFLFFAISLFLFTGSFAKDSRPKISNLTCKVNFDVAETTFNQDKLKNCIAKVVNKSEVNHILITKL